ncbi:DUF2894 domain-containing protein [Rhodoferax ferrireducens]|uniref:DUF2894 domain-containing protein n=1 Tax=Rhodoferax ferrireducens TaxID=192843 RepID=UPI000E0CCFB1|nr:DUF2894 domain-containing protein [Rhodoferax ferrireducens]
MNETVDFSGDIASLRQLGADQFDPVRLHYLQVLATRASAHQGPVKRILDAKLAKALVTFRERFEQAQRDTKDTVAPSKESDPRASLGELVRYMAQHSPDHVEGGFDGDVGLRRELKTTRYFRNTWSKLSVDKQVTQAIKQAPKNAGPINSHMLVLRSLALMREISPDYLNRFTSYVDALLCLDQCDKEKQVTAKKAADAASSKKLKTPRVRSR